MHSTADVTPTFTDGSQQFYKQVELMPKEWGAVLYGEDGRTYLYAANMKRMAVTNEIFHYTEREWNLRSAKSNESHVHVDGNCIQNKKGERCYD